MAKKHKKSGFVLFLSIYSITLIALIAVGLVWVWGLLADYETGLAEGTADKVLEEFAGADLSELVEKNGIESSEFENTDAIVLAYEKLIKDKKLVYKRKAGEYTSSAPVYYITADNIPVAEFALLQTGKNKHGFPIWQAGDIKLNESCIDTHSITVKVPAQTEVYINDVKAGDKYISAHEDISLAKNISEYVTYVPGYDIYEIDGLINTPKVRAEGEYITDMTQEDDKYACDYIEDDTILSENEELFRRIGSNYGGYIINKVSYTTLSKDLIGNAKKVMSDIPAIWAYLYGETYTYDFTDWKFENLVRYSDECFSCDISFVLNVHYRVTRLITYDTKLTGIFVKQDGRWYMADIMVG